MSHRDTLSPAARAVWDEILATTGRPTPQGAEAHTLADYATCAARLAAARASVDKDGQIILDEKGRPVPHPALTIEAAQSARLAQWSGSWISRQRK